MRKTYFLWQNRVCRGRISRIGHEKCQKWLKSANFMTLWKFQKLSFSRIFCLKFNFRLILQYLIFNCSKCWLTNHKIITPSLSPIRQCRSFLGGRYCLSKKQNIKDFFCWNFLYNLFFMILFPINMINLLNNSMK